LWCSGTEAARRSLQVPLVRSVFDFATSARPILLERVEALHHRLELEARGRTWETNFAKLLDAALDILVLHARLALLDAHEVLFVQDAQSFESVFQLAEILIDILFLCHGMRLSSTRL
jgi:hypothetical protein